MCPGPGVRACISIRGTQQEGLAVREGAAAIGWGGGALMWDPGGSVRESEFHSNALSALEGFKWESD